MAEWLVSEVEESPLERAAGVEVLKAQLRWSPAPWDPADVRAERWARWQAEAFERAAPLVGEERARELVEEAVGAEEERLVHVANGPRLAPIVSEVSGG